ncbi:MAG: ABC transporter permease subunit [Thaumarchaeota archaeon]|nr:ABC transporter permease subunit [Nitrososphaerota archaeon]
MIIALFLSVLFSLTIGITAARNRKAETVIIPTLDVLQSIPILGFFPIVIYGISAVLPGAAGVDLAVIFLIFTSMSWNIAFGVYEAVRSIPQDYLDLSSMSNSGSLQRIVSLYIPASLSRIAYNTQISWAVGLFYLISSEVISEGTSNLSVRGIGVDIFKFGVAHDYTAYAYCLVLLIVAVIIWQFVFLREFTLWAEKYRFGDDPHGAHKDSLMRMYSWINQRSLSKLFLLKPGRAVTSITSPLSRYRRGLKYSLLILFIVFLAFEVGALLNSARTGASTINLSALPSDELNVIVGLAYSFVRIWYVYFICVLVALPVGIVVALHERAYNALVPVIEVIASVPAPALLPALVPFTLLAGSWAGEITAGIVIFLGMIWYILFNVMAGIRTLPGDLWELKRSLRVSTVQAWRHIYLPSVATAFVTGSITAIGAAWNTLIVAEYFGSSGQVPLTQVGDGIGKIIVVATNRGDQLTLALAVLSMTVLVIAFNLIVWRRVYRYTTKRFAYNR